MMHLRQGISLKLNNRARSLQGRVWFIKEKLWEAIKIKLTMAYLNEIDHSLKAAKVQWNRVDIKLLFIIIHATKIYAW